MTQGGIFESETALPHEPLTAKAETLLGFRTRYARIRDRLSLMLKHDELDAWNCLHHKGELDLRVIVAEQYPFAIFCGDVGTGKTATAECIANRLILESGTEDSILYKMSNRVRGTGRVGEMGTLLAMAFQRVTQSAGHGRRSILLIDEGDSLARARSEEHSHHEDKVAVNTLIQEIDKLRSMSGRIVVILCTNRVTVLDPALKRRAAVVEEFLRPTREERKQLFSMDLTTLGLSEAQLIQLMDCTGERDEQPSWTFSDIRTRLYPAAIALAFPNCPLQFEHLRAAVADIQPSPVVEDR